MTCLHRAALNVLAGALAVCSPVLGADWTQSQNNPQRTGCTAEVIRPVGKTFPFAWQLNVLADDRIALAVQVIIVRDACYFGTLAGKFYALELATGKVRWVEQLGGPVMNTAGFAAGKVFVPCLDGKVYALDPATGGATWTSETGPVSTAVLLVKDSVYVTTRPGELVRLRQRDGKALWRYSAGVPVYGTPSCDDGRVFFIDDARRLHSVDARSGRAAWKPFKVGGGRNYPPVLTHGMVLVTMASMAPLRPEVKTAKPVDRFWDAIPGNERNQRNRKAYGKKSHIKRDEWPADYLKWVEALENYRKERGESGWLAALDQRTGRPVKFFPNQGTQSMAHPYPPPAVTADGQIVLPMHYSDWMAELGLFSLETGRLNTLLVARLSVSGDETQDFSVAGDVLFTFHTWGIGECGTQEAFDIKTGERFGFGKRPHKRWPRYKSAGPSSAAALANGYIIHNVNHRIAAWKGAGK